MCIQILLAASRKLGSFFRMSIRTSWSRYGGDNEWVNPGQIATLGRFTRSGASFGGSRAGATPGKDSELFHICRSADCRFSGFRNADYREVNKTPRAAHHVGRFGPSSVSAPGPPRCATFRNDIRWGRTRYIHRRPEHFANPPNWGMKKPGGLFENLYARKCVF